MVPASAGLKSQVQLKDGYPVVVRSKLKRKILRFNENRTLGITSLLMNTLRVLFHLLLGKRCFFPLKEFE